jgi:chromosome segregation ATPase
MLMRQPIERTGRLLAAGILVAGLVLSGSAAAQSGRIVCWKDKSGKVVGCGDKVPPEFQSNATREMDSRGVTRKQTDSVEEVNRRREREQELARQKAEENKKTLEQKRQDTALMETYASEKEIDLKRDRDLQVIDLQIEQLQGALKNTTVRYNETKTRFDAAEKAKKVPPALKDEFSRITQEKQRFETGIENRQKEKEELKVKYAEYRKRFTELRAQQGLPPASASAKK